MKHKSCEKTNAVRILDKSQIAYRLLSYDITDGLLEGKSVCDKLKLPYHLFFKTLVTTDKQGRYYVFVLPVDKELDLKKAAQVCGQKKIDMLLAKLLFNITGYEKGGCSPIAMKKTFPMYIDACHIIGPQRVYISAGKIGLCIEIDLYELVGLTQGLVANFSK